VTVGTRERLSYGVFIHGAITPLAEKAGSIHVGHKEMKHRICQCCGEEISSINLSNPNICLGCENLSFETILATSIVSENDSDREHLPPQFDISMDAA